MMNMDTYFERLYDENQPQYAMPKLPQSGKEAETVWQNWHASWTQALKSDLGGFPVQYGALNARVIREIERPEFRQQLVSFAGEDGMEIYAYLLIPHELQKPAPAVIAVAGHGAGMTEITGLTPEHEPRKLGEGYQKDFAAMLCLKGFVVLAPEMLGFGMRRFEADRQVGASQSSCFRMSMNLLMMGKSMAGVRVRDVMRSIDYLQSLSFVDPQRIGSIGISGGGTTLMYTAALDTRLKANVISGAACTYRDSILKIFHCSDNFVPQVYRHGEMCDVLGLCVPRALLLEAGRDDDIFPLCGVMSCYEALQKAYGQWHEQEKLELDVFEGGHQIHGGRSYEFLQKWLKK